jgi:hypothetical protein
VGNLDIVSGMETVANLIPTIQRSSSSAICAVTLVAFRRPVLAQGSVL